MIKVCSAISAYLFFILKPDEVDHAAFCKLLSSGNLEAVIEHLQRQTVAASKFSKSEQFECWTSITDPRMVPLLCQYGFSLKVENPHDLSTLLEHVAEHSPADVVEAFLKAGLIKGLMPAYEKSQRVIKAVLAPYIARLFCEAFEEPNKSIAVFYDETIFDEICRTFDFANFDCPLFLKKLQVLWFLTCKFKHIDVSEGSFFLKLVSFLFYTAIPKEEKLNRLFMANQCEHFRAVVHLLEQKDIFSPYDFSDEDAFKCWTEFNAEGRAALKRYNLNVNVHIIEEEEPVYPICRVIQDAQNDDPIILRHVQDLLDAGATNGVESALHQSRQNNLHQIVSLLEAYLQNK
ncbi:MAG: hypothetical protein ABSA17_07335 [Rhabdochlamydiaceae bacterium]|jgi:hypothetical protein